MKTLTTLAIFFAGVFLNNTYAQSKNLKMDNKSNSVEIIRYKISSQERTNFEKAYTEAGKYLQRSAYCLGYEVIHGNDEPNNYIVIIKWTSKEDHMQGFRQSPEFMPFFNLVKPFFNNIEEMKHYDLTANKWARA